MQKYWQLLKLSWSNGFVYRTSVILWRLRNFLNSLMALTLWTVLFNNREVAFGYTQENMLTYIFLIGILHSIILATISHGLAQEIYSGNISKELVKPINTWAFIAIQDVADKLKNFGFVLIESGLLYLIFQPQLHWPGSWAMAGLFLFWLALGTLMYFFISILFGTIGFWSPDVWAAKFLFFMFVDFTAGRLYPLDIFPESIQNALMLTPFPYLSYVQLQLYLGRYTSQEIWWNTLILIGWTIGLGILAKKIWNRGLRDYSAAGQ